ncbi:hypothetical protein C0583_05980 [Candidatus Parcubacteria bacterium]|nr:MAG: hypothetical protein C0583_05980 [Candidatus Parcubacteria bacterium]
MQCEHKKEKGGQCLSRALKGEQHCFWHSEKISEKEKMQARRNGGIANKNLIKHNLHPIEIKQAEDIISLLNEVINEVRGGRMDNKTANCIGVLSGQLLKAYEQISIKSKIETIEAIVVKKKIKLN